MNWSRRIDIKFSANATRYTVPSRNIERNSWISRFEPQIFADIRKIRKRPGRSTRQVPDQEEFVSDSSCFLLCLVPIFLPLTYLRKSAAAKSQMRIEPTIFLYSASVNTLELSVCTFPCEPRRSMALANVSSSGGRRRCKEDGSGPSSGKLFLDLYTPNFLKALRPESSRGGLSFTSPTPCCVHFEGSM